MSLQASGSRFSKCFRIIAYRNASGIDYSLASAREFAYFSPFRTSVDEASRLSVVISSGSGSIEICRSFR